MKAPALLIGIGKPKGGGESMAAAEEDEGDEREAFEAFADAAGIAEEKREDAYAAFVAAVQACIAREKSGGYEEE